MAVEPATPAVDSRAARWRLIALAVGLLALIEVMYQTRRGELDVYLIGAERMVEGAQLYVRGGDPIYHTPAFTYPPFFALVFVPLLALPKVAQAPVWGFVTWCALLGVIELLRRTLALVQPANDPRARTRELIFWGVLVLLVGRHLLSIIEALSHDVLTLLLVTACVYYLSRGREKVSGLCAGLAAACKATPILFAPLFIWQRRWTAAACVMLAATAATLLPDVTTPNRTHIAWVADWYQTFLRNVKPGATVEEPGGWQAWSEANQSLSGSLYRLLNAPTTRPDEEERDISIWNPGPRGTKACTLAAQLGVFFTMLWSAWSRRAPSSINATDVRLFLFGQGAIIATAMPLLSPMSSKSHFGVLLLPVAYCLAYYLYRRRDWLVALLLASTFVVGTLTMKSLVGHLWGRYFLGCGTVTWCALASFLAAARTVQLQLRDWKAVTRAAIEKSTNRLSVLGAAQQDRRARNKSSADHTAAAQVGAAARVKSTTAPRASATRHEQISDGTIIRY